jgi:ribose transport system substrate-binding protein
MEPPTRMKVALTYDQCHCGLFRPPEYSFYRGPAEGRNVDDRAQRPNRAMNGGEKMQRRFLSTESERRRRRLAPSWRALAVAAVAALLVSACGSASSSSTNASSASASNAAATAGSTSTSSGSASTDAASTSTSSCLSQAKHVVDPAEAPMTIETPTQPIQMSKLKGKLVYFISVGSGYSLRLANGFVAAAHAAGLNPVIFTGATPQDWNTGIQQAVSRHAAGIMMMPIQPALVAASLAQARAAGIPVVNENSVPPPATGVTANVLVPTVGAQIAAYAALQTNCNVHALLSYDPTFVGLVAIADSVKSELKLLCPTTCTSQDLVVNLATVATQAGSALQSALQRNPSINAVIPTFDSLGLVMAPALAQGGSSAKLYSFDGDAPNIELVRKGVQAADYSYAPTEYQGYIDLDALARTMLKLKANPSPVQFQLFNRSDLPSSNDFSAMWPKLTGYQSAFMKLWGLQ